MTTLIAFLALATPIDGEDAVGIARRFLQKMGVESLAGLNTLSEGRGQDWQRPGARMWSVGFDLKEGGWISAKVDERGEVFYACRSSYSGGIQIEPSRARRFGAALMARIPDAIRVQQDPSDPAQFHAVVDGRRYFNLNPRYGYRIAFDERGNLMWFDRQDNPPKPTSRTPKIPEATARERLTELWKASKPTDWPYPRHIETELGYYHRKNEDGARLVYRGTVYFTSPESRTKGEMGPLKTLIDARTGEAFEVDDQ